MDDFDRMSDAEREFALNEMWEDSHPYCESCGKRGCGHGCCDNLDGLVMLTDGLIFHVQCLVKEQIADAAFGNAEYRMVGERK